MGQNLSTSASRTLARFSGLASAENTEETATTRMDAGRVAPPSAGIIRNCRNLNRNNARPAPLWLQRRRVQWSSNMRTYTASDAAKSFGEVLEAADLDPVIIRRHGRPRAAIIGWRLYERYRQAYDAAFEQRQLALLETSLNALVDGKLGRGQRALALVQRLRPNDPPTKYDPPADETAGA